MLLLAGILLARQAGPALGRLAQRLAPVYAANRLLLVTSLASSAGTAGAPTLLAAAVQRGAALGVCWLTRRRAVTDSNECGGGSAGNVAGASSSHQRTLLLVAPLLLAVDASQGGGISAAVVALEIALRSCVGTAAYGAAMLGNLASLAAIRLLLCSRTRIPYSGRTALLPRPWLEFCLNHTIGFLSALTYPVVAFAGEMKGLQGLLSIIWLPRSLETAGQHHSQVRVAHARLHGTAQRVALKAGRRLLPTLGVSASMVPVTSVNAACCPGGHVFVHSGLMEAVRAKEEVVTFVVGHEVGHALARHAAERVVRAVMQPLVISLAVGGASLLATAVRNIVIEDGRQRDEAAWRWRHPLLRIFPPGRRHERAARENTALLVGQVNVAAQVGLNVAAFFAGLAASRQAEHEADFLALCLARDAGIPGAMDGARAFFAVRPPWWDLSWLVPTFLSTHPSSKQRMRVLRRRARLRGA